MNKVIGVGNIRIREGKAVRNHPSSDSNIPVSKDVYNKGSEGVAVSSIDGVSAVLHSENVV